MKIEREKKKITHFRILIDREELAQAHVTFLNVDEEKMVSFFGVKKLESNRNYQIQGRMTNAKTTISKEQGSGIKLFGK